MPVRQGPPRPTARPESPPGRTETLPADEDEAAPESPTLPTVVVEVEEESGSIGGESTEQNVEVEDGEKAEESREQQPDVDEQYEDEGFERDTEDGVDEADSVTSTDGGWHVLCVWQCDCDSVW